MRACVVAAFGMLLCADARTPLYIALRMDDISLGWLSETQASVIQWAVTNDVKFTFGVISGNYPNGPSVPWPTTCLERPSDANCDDPAVMALFQAYGAGRVRGATTSNATIEIANHAWNHGEWGAHFTSDDQESYAAFAQGDMQRSAGALRAAYPQASIRTFIAPENLANAEVVSAMQANGLDIISTQGTLGCKQSKGSPPLYNYFFAPCQHDNVADCIPIGDVYVTSAGFQKTSTGIYSVPIGSANSDMSNVGLGISAAEAWGEGTCGCTSKVCSAIASAEANALKSNGVHWTSIMLHPQTTFSGQSYVEWLNAFVALSQSSSTYDVRFVHFQDVVDLSAPSEAETAFV